MCHSVMSPGRKLWASDDLQCVTGFYVKAQKGGDRTRLNTAASHNPAKRETFLSVAGLKTLKGVVHVLSQAEVSLRQSGGWICYRRDFRSRARPPLRTAEWKEAAEENRRRDRESHRPGRREDR